MATLQLQQLPASAALPGLKTPPTPWRAAAMNLPKQQQQNRQRDAAMTIGPRSSAPAGTGKLKAAADASRTTPTVPAATACAATAATAAAAALPTAGPIYRYRKRRGGAAAAEGFPEQVSRGPPLLFSRATESVYMLLEPIVGMEGAKPNVELHMAAPIVVLNRNEALSPSGGATGADVLFRPHSTKRVVIKVREEITGILT